MADLVPYHDRDGFIWFDGKLVPWREANLHVLSHGLHYASAVFEGERAYGGEIFELTQHTKRLTEGAKTMDFEIPYSVAEIDQAMQAGAAHPMGPLTLADFVGLDTLGAISEVMFDEFRERRFAAPPTLRKMLTAGWYGRKSGTGFYDYSSDEPVPNPGL